MHWPKGIAAKGELRHFMGHVVGFLPTFIEMAGADPLKEKYGYEAQALPGESQVSLFEKINQWNAKSISVMEGIKP